jgi:tetratricopeptide (TPR) repeat protein
MRAFVFTDQALTSRARQFVWLALDTDQARNAPFAEKFGIEAWPSFYVLDAKNETVALRWVGAMTVAQVQSFLDDALLAIAGTTPASAAEAALASADKLFAEGQGAQAAPLYRRALDAAPAAWPRYGRTVEALETSYQSLSANDLCVDLARESAPRLAGTSSALVVAAAGLDCALDLPPDLPARAGNVAEMEAAVRRAIEDPRVDAAADDRSAAYLALVQARKDARDKVGALKLAGEWASFLEAQAAAASTPEQRAVFDSHRLSAYLELGQPQLAIPMLEAAERDLPEDYNPPARLAVAYRAMGRWDDALAAYGRALPKVQGPRKVRVLDTLAGILAEKGDGPGSLRTLKEALAYAKSLPEGQRSKATISALEKRLATAEQAQGTTRP